MTTGRINQVTAALGLIIKKSYHNTRSADSRDLKYDTLYYSADAVLRPRHAEAGGFGVCLIFSCLFKICREAGQVLKKNMFRRSAGNLAWVSHLSSTTRRQYLWLRPPLRGPYRGRHGGHQHDGNK